MRFFLKGVLTLITCFIFQTANAEKGLIFYGNAKVSGKENMFVYQDSSDFSIYHPEQRQKLSIAATQCGELTSFGAHYPPAFITVSLQIAMTT